MGCLYRIDVGGRAYIGITSKTAEARFSAHVYEAGKGTRGALYNAIRKYGADRASVTTLVAEEDWGVLCNLERQAIARLNTRSPFGLNMTDGGDGASPGSAHHAGFKHTDEAKAKMAAAKRGKPRPEITRLKIAAANIGNKHNLGRTASAETKQKMATSQSGKKRTPEQRARISEAAKQRETKLRIQRGQQ